MKFPVGSLISSYRYPLQVCKVLNYDDDEREFFIDVITDADGNPNVDTMLDLSVEFYEEEWFHVTDLIKALV
jgi:hypothetical protein